MKFFKSFSIWLLRSLCVAAISGMVYVVTLSTTLLDRGDAKQWLGSSGLYDDGQLISALFNQEAIDEGTRGTPMVDQNLVSNESITRALQRTFPASFIQTSFDTVIDSSYDWMEGKGSQITFSIPVNDKRDMFIAELVTELQPQVEALPACSRTNLTSLCRPPSIPPATFTQQIISDNLSSSDFLRTPLTDASFSTAFGTQDTTILTQLPRLRAAVSALLYILPVVAILCALGAGLISPHGSRLKLYIKLARTVFTSMLFSLILASVVLILQHNQALPIEQLLPNAGPLAPLIAAVITQVINGFMWALILYSGITFVISAFSWGVLFIIKKRKSKQPPFVASNPPYLSSL